MNIIRRIKCIGNKNVDNIFSLGLTVETKILILLYDCCQMYQMTIKCIVGAEHIFIHTRKICIIYVFV